MHFRPEFDRYSPSDLSWLGSRHAVDTALHREGDYWVPVTSKTQSVDGFLLTDQDNNPGEVVPIVWHGRVRIDRLPDSNNRVNIADCDHAEFTFVHEPHGSLWNEDGSTNFDAIGDVRED